MFSTIEIESLRDLYASLIEDWDSDAELKEAAMQLASAANILPSRAQQMIDEWPGERHYSGAFDEC